MKRSLFGDIILPETRDEFEQLRTNVRDKLLYLRCTDCGEGFTEHNVKTAEGWEETQISGMCENCYDFLFSED